MRRIYEHYARGQIRKTLREFSNVDSAEGPPNQHVRAWRFLGFQEPAQIIDYFIRRLEMADSITVPFACTIIAADPRKAFNASLNGSPYFEAGSQAIEKNNGYLGWDAGAMNV